MAVPTFPHNTTLRALRSRLRTAVGFPGDALTAWWNEPFTPPSSGLWLRERYAPAGETLIAHGMIEARGIYAVGVAVRKGYGSGAALTLAAAIGTAYRPGPAVGTITLDGHKVELDSAALGSAYEIDAAGGDNPSHVILPVEVRWRAYAIG